jgi:hypothetical protein
MPETPDLDRRRFLAAAATTAAAGQLGLLGFTRRVQAMTGVMTEGQTGTQKTDIRPFHFKVSDADLTDLRRRINATKWPERETVSDNTKGVQSDTIRKLARYWGTEYDWRKGEAKLNAVPHFITEIDGLDIHFIHAKGMLRGGSR